MLEDEEKIADLVFTALSHKSRRQILDQLRDKPGITVGNLAKCFDVSRIAVMQHLKILTEAGLVESDRNGRTRQLYLNYLPLHRVHARWFNTF